MRPTKIWTGCGRPKGLLFASKTAVVSKDGRPFEASVLTAAGTGSGEGSCLCALSSVNKFARGDQALGNQEVRGFNQQYTRSDEQQDGMRPDGLVGLGLVAIIAFQALLVSRGPLLPLTVLLVLLLPLLQLLLPPTPPLLLRHQRRCLCTASTSTQPDHTSKLPGTSAQRATQPSRHIILRLGRTWLARHPSPVTRHRPLGHCRKSQASLACRGLEAAYSRARPSKLILIITDEASYYIRFSQ